MNESADQPYHLHTSRLPLPAVLKGRLSTLAPALSKAERLVWHLPSGVSWFLGAGRSGPSGGHVDKKWNQGCHFFRPTPNNKSGFVCHRHEGFNTGLGHIGQPNRKLKESPRDSKDSVSANDLILEDRISLGKLIKFFTGHGKLRYAKAIRKETQCRLWNNEEETPWHLWSCCNGTTQGCPRCRILNNLSSTGIVDRFLGTNTMVNLSSDKEEE